MKPESVYAHTSGLYFSIPTILAFVFFSIANKADNPSQIFLLVVVIVCIMSLPWSFISLVIYLIAVPMNSGVFPGMEGYYWRLVLMYSAPVLTILGAHFNGYMFGRSRFRNLASKRKKEIEQNQS